MNTQRLLDVVAVLETTPDDAFNMNHWWKENCKTVGCAVGHYCHQRPGCGIEVRYGDIFHSGEMDWDCDTGSFDVVAEHFDIDKGAADYLFDPTAYEDEDEDFEVSGITRARVMSRIRDFVASGGAIAED